jgi:hypothetical protein
MDFVGIRSKTFEVDGSEALNTRYHIVETSDIHLVCFLPEVGHIEPARDCGAAGNDQS